MIDFHLLRTAKLEVPGLTCTNLSSGPTSMVTADPDVLPMGRTLTPVGSIYHVIVQAHKGFTFHAVVFDRNDGARAALGQLHSSLPAEQTPAIYMPGAGQVSAAHDLSMIVIGDSLCLHCQIENGALFSTKLDQF